MMPTNPIYPQEVHTRQNPLLAFANHEADFAPPSERRQNSIARHISVESKVVDTVPKRGSKAKSTFFKRVKEPKTMFSIYILPFRAVRGVNYTHMYLRANPVTFFTGHREFPALPVQSA